MSSKSKNLSRERVGFYAPMIAKIEKDDNNILDSKNDITVSSNVDYPRFEYGFHHFIHADKNKMSILDSFKNKKKVYYVLNEFERYIDDYDNDIGALSKKFFKDGKRTDIITRGFYKIWEILMYYDLIDSQKDFTSLHISDGPNPFVQATMYYRNMYCNGKKDTYHTLEGTGKSTSTQDAFEKQYKKEVKYSKSVSAFDKDVKSKVDFITGDRGKEWNNENIQEQESFDIILEQILTAVKHQKKGGHFVCKFFETFTHTSLKFVSLLQSMYDDVQFIKPLSSRGSNSEKYAVCRNFKLSDKDAKDVTKKLESIYENVSKLGDKQFLVDIFPKHKFGTKFLVSMSNINKTVANEQLKSIGMIVTFIEGRDYHGDVYREHREKQIAAADFWSKTFLLDPKSLKDGKKKASSLLEKDEMEISNEYTRLTKVLVAPREVKGVDRKQSRTTSKKKGKSKTGSKSKKKSTTKSKKSSSKKNVKVKKSKA